MKKILFLTCIVLMLSTACENKSFFEFDRPVQNPWTTLGEFDRAAIGSYFRLYATGAYANAFSIWCLYKNAEADDVAWVAAGDSWGYFRTRKTKRIFYPLYLTTGTK